MNGNNSICVLPKLSGLGGPTSFQARFVEGLRRRGIDVHHDPSNRSVASILVIGAPRRWMAEIWRARRRGVRIVQRLNGMNWVHKRIATGWKHYLRAEMNNWALSAVRRYLANRIVYQSQFTRHWWQTVYGRVNARGTIIYNGVDLARYNPDGPYQRPADHIHLLMVEGHLGGGYEQGLRNAIRLTQLLNYAGPARVELLVVGDVPAGLQSTWQEQADIPIQWLGVQPRDRIPEIDRSAHLMFSADLNAACPNSVVEALACGLPVVGYATGSLPELVQNESGRVAPYGTNFWKLEAPDAAALARAAQEIIASQEIFRQGARQRAEAVFSLETMLDKYMEVML